MTNLLQSSFLQLWQLPCYAGNIESNVFPPLIFVPQPTTMSSRTAASLIIASWEYVFILLGWGGVLLGESLYSILIRIFRFW